MLRTSIIIGLAVCVAVPGASLAQTTPTPTPAPLRNDSLSASRAARTDSVSRDPTARLSPTRDTVKSMRTYEHLLKYGDCISRLGKDSSKILAMQPYSKEERAKTVVLRERAETCQLGQVDNIHSLVRGSLAEAMYHRTIKQAPGQTFDAARAASFVAANDAFNKSREESDQVVIGATNCMVASNPDIAYRVLTSDHGSDAEAAAMDQLFSLAPLCAGAQRPADLSRSFLRAFVADSAWQFANWSQAGSNSAVAK